MAPRLTAMIQAANRTLNRMVDATPPARNRSVDFLRAFSIGVVVVWHWALSVNQWADGELVMPNPIADVPAGWLATWLLQVMPVFFLVGGFANLAAWDSADGTRPFLRRRFVRLLLPTAVFVAVWALVDGMLLLVVPGYRTVLDYGMAVFMPLWFLGAYLWVTLLVPITAAAHRRAPILTLSLLGAAVLLADLGRFGAGLTVLGVVNTALVWVFVHQLGYLWRDGFFVPSVRRWVLTTAGLAGLTVVALLEVYPRSMVATVDAELSNIYPTTVVIAVLAVFQLGVILLLEPWLERWLTRRRPWKAVVAVNVVIMTVFLWHMTALLIALRVVEWAGIALYEQPTAEWWAQRPLWLLLPGLFLVVLVALFMPVENRVRNESAGGGRQR